jgi:hypothetical protein
MYAGGMAWPWVHTLWRSFLLVTTHFLCDFKVKHCNYGCCHFWNGPQKHCNFGQFACYLELACVWEGQVPLRQPFHASYIHQHCGHPVCDTYGTLVCDDMLREFWNKSWSIYWDQLGEFDSFYPFSVAPSAVRFSKFIDDWNWVALPEDLAVNEIVLYSWCGATAPMGQMLAKWLA